MENLNVNQEMNFEEMADVVGGVNCHDLVEFAAIIQKVGTYQMYLDVQDEIFKHCVVQ
jgi:hypothetical protein